MANWLAPLKNLGGGFLGLSSRDMREVITEGVDIVMKQRRTDLIPQFIYGVPQGVAIINDVQSLEVFLAGIVAAAVRNNAWLNTRFAFPAKAFKGIEYTPPWRALVNGLARHDYHPILMPERDVYVFADTDWHVAQIKIGIGLG